MSEACPVCGISQGPGLWDHLEKCRLKWAAEHQCPWSWMHRPGDPVIIGRTTVGNIVDEFGRKIPARSEEKTIRYVDWEGRCRICYPR